jgi:glycosyltransferase involved in cell wall biosynthesis
MHIGINAHLLSSQASYRAAGIHNVIHNLLRHLPAVAPEGWRFTALVGAKQHARYDGVAMRRARLDTEHPARRILWEQVLQPPQLLEFDLYHATAFVAPALLLSKSVVMVHDLSFIRYPQAMPASRRLYLRWLTALSCARAQRVIANSHSTAHDTSSLLGVPADKIDVTPLGYDDSAHYPRPIAEIEAFKQAKGLPARFWLFVGTIEPRKNLPVLLEAYARLPRTERLPLLLGGGAGWGRDAVNEAIARHQLGDSVRLLGFIPSDELPLWYNSAEAFLYPSVFEGFGLPVLEAMACGTPVLTSNVSSLPEVAQGAGLCLPAKDVEAWAQALHHIAQDSVWRETARANGLAQAQRFHWRTTAELTIQSYQKALKA